jgi:phytoene synthase
MTAAVEQAYAEVERVTRREAKNFAYGIMVLPRPKRQAIAAIYAYARRVDDIADGDLPLERKREELEALRASLADPAPAEPMLVALADARSRYPIPDSALTALVDGGLQDTTQARYAATARRSPAPSASRASRSTARTTPSAPARSGSRCS